MKQVQLLVLLSLTISLLQASIQELPSTKWEVIAQSSEDDPETRVYMYKNTDQKVSGLANRLSFSFLEPTDSYLLEKIAENKKTGPDLYANNGFRDYMWAKTRQSFQRLNSLPTEEMLVLLDEEEAKIKKYKSLLKQLKTTQRVLTRRQALHAMIEIEKKEKTFQENSECPNPFLVILLEELIQIKEHAMYPTEEPPATPFLTFLQTYMILTNVIQQEPSHRK